MALSMLSVGVGGGAPPAYVEIKYCWPRAGVNRAAPSSRKLAARVSLIVHSLHSSLVYYLQKHCATADLMIVANPHAQQLAAEIEDSACPPVARSGTDTTGSDRAVQQPERHRL